MLVALLLAATLPTFPVANEDSLSSHHQRSSRSEGDCPTIIDARLPVSTPPRSLRTIAPVRFVVRGTFRDVVHLVPACGQGSEKGTTPSARSPLRRHDNPNRCLTSLQRSRTRMDRSYNGNYAVPKCTSRRN
jgi:hypothetical protein